MSTADALDRWQAAIAGRANDAAHYPCAPSNALELWQVAITPPRAEPEREDEPELVAAAPAKTRGRQRA